MKSKFYITFACVRHHVHTDNILLRNCATGKIEDNDE